MKPRVAIIYLCYNILEYLPEVVSSFEELNYPNDRLGIAMVPNASPDGIERVIRDDLLPRSKKDLPEVVLIEEGKNDGFAEGNNKGIRWALENDFDYIFLNNGDLTLHPDAINELVNLAESDERIGSAQSMVVYWDDHEQVNTSGGEFHVAGYGYARDNLGRLEDLKYENGDEIIYASGAAVLYRASALRRVGLLEKGFFMYHEDLELGLRLKMAGYTNHLCTTSFAYHDYHFSRNPMKFAWMELYRWVVVLSYYKVATLVVLFPLLMVIELGTWVMAVKNNWLKAKLWAYAQAMLPRTWRLIIRMRKRAQQLRIIPDTELLKLVTGKIEGQEANGGIVNRIANPIISVILSLLKKVIRW
jgi:GT2 family glycosyltransferase